MTIGSFNTNAMRLTDLDVINHSNVNSAIDRLDEALEYVSAQRAELGATQVRFESMVNSLNVAMETTSASRGRIADADYATEATALTQAQIVQQASVSLLAQANALPTLSLALLN
jgi:flagellin